MRKLIYLTLLIFICAAPIITAQKTVEDKIVNMLELTGSKANYDVAIEQMIQIQKGAYLDILGDDFFDEFERRAKEELFTELSQRLIPIYLKHLTEKDIDGIIAFYKTDTGIILLEKNPLIMAESMQVGAELGAKLGEDIAQSIVTKSMEVENENKFNTVVEEDCSGLREGKFYYYLPDSTRLDVIRTADQQTEIRNGIETTKMVKWVSNNRYLITGMQELGKELPGDALTINIYEITENGYRFMAKMPDVAYYLDGEMFIQR